MTCNKNCFSCEHLCFDAGEPWCYIGNKTIYEDNFHKTLYEDAEEELE